MKFVESQQIALLTTIGLLLSYVFLLLALTIKFRRFNGLGDPFFLFLVSVGLVTLAGYIAEIW